MTPNSVVSFSQERLDLLRQFEEEVRTIDPRSKDWGECITRYNVMFQMSVTEAGDLRALQQLEAFAPPNESAAKYLQARIQVFKEAEARKNAPRHSFVVPWYRGGRHDPPADLVEV